MSVENLLPSTSRYSNNALASLANIGDVGYRCPKRIGIPRYVLNGLRYKYTLSSHQTYYNIL